MSVTPDLAGYRDAQVRKRDALASQVIFHFAVTEAWPAGTVLDEHGKPFDPQIEPESSTGVEPQSRCLSVAFKPVKRGLGASDSEESRWGDMKVNYAFTWMTLEEWAEFTGEFGDPVSFDYSGDNYLIRKTTEEGIAGQPWRMLIWGERQGEEA